MFFNQIFIIFIICFMDSIFARRHTIRRHIKSNLCKEPPNLKEELATWMQQSLKGSKRFEEIPAEEWNSSGKQPEICNKSPKVEGDASIMDRALCPWENRVNFEESREPQFLAESVCLCRKSRGNSSAFCLPIIRNVPILRRISCNSNTGYWNYVRTSQMITVGCHSVLPRTQRAVRLAHLSDVRNIPI